MILCLVRRVTVRKVLHGVTCITGELLFLTRRIRSWQTSLVETRHRWTARFLHHRENRIHPVVGQCITDGTRTTAVAGCAKWRAGV